MKIFELVNNISIQLTNEEVDLLGKFDSSSKIKKQDLNEREQVLAGNLVNKNVLARTKYEGKIYFKKKIK
jgi:hypothetical protein